MSVRSINEAMIPFKWDLTINWTEFRFIYSQGELSHNNFREEYTDLDNWIWIRWRFLFNQNKRKSKNSWGSLGILTLHYSFFLIPSLEGLTLNVSRKRHIIRKKKDAKKFANAKFMLIISTLGLTQWNLNSFELKFDDTRLSS